MKCDDGLATLVDLKQCQILLKSMQCISVLEKEHSKVKGQLSLSSEVEFLMGAAKRRGN